MMHGIEMTCPHCNLTFRQAQNRDVHIKNKHSENANRCGCGRTWVKSSGLEAHQEECIAARPGFTKAVKRKLEELTVEGSDKHAVIKRAFKETNDEKLAYILSLEHCDQCDAVFDNSESLRKHKYRKHS